MWLVRRLHHYGRIGLFHSAFIKISITVTHASFLEGTSILGSDSLLDSGGLALHFYYPAIKVASPKRDCNNVSAESLKSLANL
ncbi:MAG: hypothetical protein ACJA0N_002738 [Pseudohongiellaceae bacterium]